MRLRPRLAPPLALCLLALPAAAQHGHGGPHLPNHFELVEIPGTWERPCALAFAPDGTLFVGEKIGVVRVHDGTQMQGPAFLNLFNETNSRDDRGLLGLALHPGFVPDGGATSWVYVAYTATPILGEDPVYDQDQKYSWSILARWRATTNAQGAIVAQAGSKQYLLGERLPDGTAPTAIASLRESHSNGSLVFGDDGTLMISCGEGAFFVGLDVGGADDPGFDDFVHPVTGLKGQIPKDQDSGAFRAQDLRSLAGKVLRIDPETGLGLPSNPFYDGDPNSLRSRVWCLGLRNAFRMAHLPGTGSADPALGDPGLFVVSDVGSQFYEELNLVDGPGLNFQWPCVEGDDPQPLYSVYDRPEPNPFGYLDCGDPQVGVQRPPILAWTRFDPAALYPPGTPSYDHHGMPDGGFGGSAAIAGAFYTGAGGYPSSYDGRLFLADYGYDWVRTVEFDANFQVLAVHEFAAGFDNVVDMEVHPVTGEVVVAQLLDSDGTDGHVWRVRYGANASPTAVLDPQYAPGTAPILVTLDASASSDPEGDPLTYTYDPGDGTAPITTTADSIQHTYVADGSYTASVEVEDSLGLSNSTTAQVLIGVTPPAVEITSPFQGHEVLSPADVAVTGQGVDLDGLGPVTLTWDLVLHHNTHTHPSTTGSGPSFLAQLGDHGTYGDLVFHEVVLTGTTVTGTSASARLWIYDPRQVFDRTGRSRFLSSLDTLVPPVPQGTGNPDSEVLRDGVTAPGATPALAQFNTSHGGDQGDVDWIGWELVDPPGPYDRFVGVDLTSGQVSVAGGWFETLAVEVRQGGQWIEVEDLAVDPPYPTGPTAPLGTDFTTYRLRFRPTEGDAVRLVGNPGGTTGFVSAAELRAVAIAPNPIGDVRDATEEGTIIARVFELFPPGSLGKGNPDVGVIADGVEPEAGSSSQLAQFASFHNGDQGDVDWYGYAFDVPHTFTALHFREGLHFWDGGWFEDLSVQVRERPTGPWTTVSSLLVSPPLRNPGPWTLSYEAFDLTFAPVVGRQIRLRGKPGGSSKFTTVSELRVFVRAGDPAVCVVEKYGEGWPGNELLLDTATPAVLGLPAALQVTGCAPSTLGWVAMCPAPLDLDLGAGQRGLVDPTLSLVLLGFQADASGLGLLGFSVPNNPTLAGATVYFQAVAFDPASPLLDLSNGLVLGLCP